MRMIFFKVKNSYNEKLATWWGLNLQVALDNIIKQVNINLLSSKPIFSPLLKKLLGRNISIPTKTKVGISRALNRAFLLSIIDFKASFGSVRDFVSI